MRERTSFSLPRRSHDRKRGRVATARIDAIAALIEEGMQMKGPRARGGGGDDGSGGSGGGGGGGGGGERGGGGSGCGGGDRGHKGVELTYAEVGEIIAYMDIDQSGEVDSQVSETGNARGIYSGEICGRCVR